MLDWKRPLRRVKQQLLTGKAVAAENRRRLSAAKENALSQFPRRDMKKRGILILCYSFHGGGAERVACRLAEAFAEEAQVIMLCAELKERTYLTGDGIPVLALPRFTGPPKLKLWEQARYTAWLKKKFRVDAAISFMFTMNRLNAASKGRELVICSERNNPARREPEHMEEIERIYRRADHVVFQTETVRNLFSDAVRAHSSVIPNPVEAPCERLGTSPRIVTLGRLTPQKNQAMLLRAFARFHALHPQYSLTVYGEGQLLEQLQALSEELGIREAVSFPGNVMDVHRQIADAEIFVLSSDYEGMSNALMECMAMGFPCISTACEGSVDLIRSGENGILTAVGDENALVEAMSLLAENRELRERLGANARRTAAEFRTPLIMDRWRQLVQRGKGQRDGTKP